MGKLGIRKIEEQHHYRYQMAEVDDIADCGQTEPAQQLGTEARLDVTFSTLRTTGILVGAALGFGAIGAVSGFATGLAGEVFVAATLTAGAALSPAGVDATAGNAAGLA